MMYKTHVAFGILLGLLAFDYFNVDKYAFFAAVIFGSIFVDIDEAGSFIGRRTWPISNMIAYIFGHRGLFHSIFLAALIFFVLYHFGYAAIAFGFLIGYLSHLAADTLTIDGVRLFYPFSRTAIRGFITTNGLMETIFFILVLFAIGYILI